jgi:hypothetical protein
VQLLVAVVLAVRVMGEVAMGMMAVAYLCGYFEFCRPSHSPSKGCLTKICQKSGQAHPDARKIFRAFFVAAKPKTIELSVRSLCATARSTDPEVGYKPQSPLKLEYIRQENGTSTDCAFFSQLDYLRIARNTSSIDAKHGAHFLQADFRVLIRTFSGRMLAQVCEGVVQLASSPACQAGGCK